MNLFFVFIYILLYELRNYINEKNNFDFNNVGKVYANIDKLTPQDKALVETFIETGKKSYLDIFSKLDLSKRDKIIKIRFFSSLVGQKLD